MNSFRERFDTYQLAKKKTLPWVIAIGILVLLVFVSPLVWWKLSTEASVWRILCVIAGIIIILPVVGLITNKSEHYLMRYFYQKIIKK